MMVGRLLSLWDGKFSGAMLNFEGVFFGIFTPILGEMLQFLEQLESRTTLQGTNNIPYESPALLSRWLGPFSQGQICLGIISAISFVDE